MPDYLDVPTLLFNDTWSYYTDMDITGTYYYEGNPISLTGTLTGNMDYTVVGIETIDMGTWNNICYRVNFTGTYDIFMTGALMSAQVVADNSGMEYWCVDDLSLYKITESHNGIINVTSFFDNFELTYNMTQNVTFDASLEDYDFPLIVGEEWNQTYTREADMSGDIAGENFTNTTNQLLSNSVSCVGTEVQDTAGEYFNTYSLDFENGEQVRYYSGDARNVVFTEVNSGNYLELPDLVIGIDEGSIELTSYDVGDFSLGDDITQDMPFGIPPESSWDLAGSMMGVESDAVTVIIPKLNMSEEIPISNGSFDQRIFIGGTSDETPCECDIGSHGVIVMVNDFELYEIKTLTVARPDIRIFDENVSFSPGSGAALNSPFNITVELNNPSLTFLENARVSAVHEEIQVTQIKNVTLCPMSTAICEFQFESVPPLGLHHFNFTLDPEELINETFETNNNVVVEYDILPRPVPEIIRYGPDEENITLNEGESQLLFIELNQTPFSEYNTSWYLENGGNYELVQRNISMMDYTFSTEYTGEMSSINSPFKVRCIVIDEATLGHFTKNSIEWNISVVNVNQPPVIVDVSPASMISMNENESWEFVLTCEDEDGDVLEYTWFRDGLEQNITTNNYIYKADYNSSGDHTIMVRASDGKDLVSHTWNFDVGNINRNCIAVLTQPAQSEFKVGDLINFSAEGSFDPDLKPGEYNSQLIYEWDFGDGNGDVGMQLNHSYSKSGKFQVQLTVKDKDGSRDTRTIILNISKVNVPDNNGSDDDNDDGDDDLTESEKDLESIYISSIAFLVIGVAILLILWFFMEVKRSKLKRKIADELVMLEEEREEILQDIDRVKGKLDQVEWDYDDEYISQARYNRLKHTYRNKLGELRDRLVEVEDRISEKEDIIGRQKKRQESDRRTYGGGASDDFYKPSYKEMEDIEDKDYERYGKYDDLESDEWEDGDSWDDEDSDDGWSGGRYS